MKAKLLYLFIIILLLSNSVLLFMLLKKPHEIPERARGFLMSRLELSKEQMIKFEELDRAHRGIMMDYDDDINEYKKHLFKAVSEGKKINTSISQKIGAYEGEKQEEVFRFLSEVRKLCNDEQLEALDNVFKEVLFSKKQTDDHQPPPPRGHLGPPDGHRPPKGHRPPPR